MLKITVPLEEARESTHLKDFFIYLYHWVPNSRQEFSLYTGILANKWQADGIIVLFCNSLWTNQSRHWGIHIWLKGQLDITWFWTEDHTYYCLWNSCKKIKFNLNPIKILDCTLELLEEMQRTQDPVKRQHTDEVKTGRLSGQTTGFLQHILWGKKDAGEVNRLRNLEHWWPTVIFVPHLNPRSNKRSRYDNLNTRYDKELDFS